MVGSAWGRTGGHYGVADLTAGAAGSFSSPGPEGFTPLSPAWPEDTGIGPVMHPATNRATTQAIIADFGIAPSESRPYPSHCGFCTVPSKWVDTLYRSVCPSLATASVLASSSARCAGVKG